MSKSTAFYVKDMNVSEDEDQDMTHEDIWDDRKLNEAYDKALKLANAEVARRLAMATNSEGNSKTEVSQNKTEQPKANARNQKKKLKWKSGMPCRAVYEADGLEYEACVLSIVNDKKCYVRFLGYNNTEVVQISTLKPSQGEEARARQIEEALVAEQQPLEYMSHSSHAGSVTGEFADRNLLEAESTTSKHSKVSKKKKQNKKQTSVNGFNLPEMPFPMPNLSMLMNSGSHEMPLPPPPLPTGGQDDEQQAVSAMLLSWYMSGYYTGLYQGMKRSQESGRNK